MSGPVDRGGVAAGVGAYTLWGALPLYWKLLDTVPVGELLAHRIVWSFLGLLAIVTVGGGVRSSWARLEGRVAATYTLAAALIGVNWLLYVWAVNGGRVVEVSLGYFVNPLLSVVLGVVVFGERLRRAQWAAVAVAVAGVAVMAVGTGSTPWVSLALVATFGCYGLVKKLAPLPSLDGVLLETAILVVPAAIVLIAAEGRGGAAFLHHGVGFDTLLVGAGVATTVPLVLFAVAVRRIPLSMIGLLQYLAPSLQLGLGVLVFGEPFGGARAAAFGLVWLALALVTVDGLAARR